MNDNSDIPYITTKVSDPGPLENKRGKCLSKYTVTIIVGDRVYHLPAYITCEWLKDGHWQGHWQKTAGDGLYLPRPTVEDSAMHEAPDDTIVIWSAGKSVEIMPEHIPAWAEAVTTLYKTRVDEADAACNCACDIRGKLVDALRDALYEYDIPIVPAPSPKDVYDGLPKSVFPHIRWGDWNGAGKVVAWKYNGSRMYIAWPNEKDVLQALQGSTDSLYRQMVHDLNPTGNLTMINKSNIPPITIKIGAPEYIGERWGQEYTVTIIVGDQAYHVPGYITRDRQKKVGDGMYWLRPVVDDSGRRLEPSDPIVILSPGGESVEIMPEHVPAWAKAMQAMAEAMADGDDGLDDLYTAACDIRDEITEALRDALAAYKIPKADEPEPTQPTSLDRPQGAQV